MLLYYCISKHSIGFLFFLLQRAAHYKCESLSAYLLLGFHLTWAVGNTWRWNRTEKNILLTGYYLQARLLLKASIIRISTCSFCSFFFISYCQCFAVLITVLSKCIHHESVNKSRTISYCKYCLKRCPLSSLHLSRIVTRPDITISHQVVCRVETKARGWAVRRAAASLAGSAQMPRSAPPVRRLYWQPWRC